MVSSADVLSQALDGSVDARRELAGSGAEVEAEPQQRLGAWWEAGRVWQQVVEAQVAGLAGLCGKDLRGSYASNSTVPVLPEGQGGIGCEAVATLKQLAVAAQALGGGVGEPAVPALAPT